MTRDDILLLLALGILGVSIICWIVSVTRKYVLRKKVVAIAPLPIITIGTVFSAILVFVLYYTRLYEDSLLLACLSVAQQTIMIFGIDDSIKDILSSLETTAESGVVLDFSFFKGNQCFQTLAVSLFVLAPITTFTAALSIFTRIWYCIKNRISVFREKHVFAELNERTIALAESICRARRKQRGQRGDGKETLPKIRKPLIVFTDFIDKNEETYFDLTNRAKRIGAVLFRKDLEAIHLNWCKHRKINFYLASDDEAENLRHASHIWKHYNHKKTTLYLFSDSIESEMFMKEISDRSAFTGDAVLAAEKYLRAEMPCGIKKAAEIKDYSDKRKEYLKELGNPKNLKRVKRRKLRELRKGDVKFSGARINEIRFLVYQYLYDHGAELFADAKKIGDLKTIHATVVGYGKHGEEFVKALLWYCQLPGYKFDLTVIDSDKNAQSRFRAKLAGLVTDQDFDDPGDVRYRISFKTLTVGTKEFADEVKRGGEEKRHFFLCLGDDTLNTNAYRMIKQERERIHARTSITAVIRNAVTKKLINGENIRVIGDFKDYYSMKIFTSDNSLIGLGYEEHKRWTENAWSIFEDKSDKKKRKSKKPWLRYAQNTYYFNDYNFYSSISKAIHRGLHAKGADLGVDKKYQAILENTKDIGSAIDYCALVSDKLEQYDKGILEDREAFECELQAIAELEHVRWNAYMLTEGWIAGPIKDKKCKVHDLLVSVEKLPYDEILKDI